MHGLKGEKKNNLLKYLGVNIDKLIKKVKKDLDKGEKHTKVLLKADKKFDREIEEAKKIKKNMKKGKC